MPTTAAPSVPQAEQVEVRVVDCDVHLVPRSPDELVERTPEPWRSRLGGWRADKSGGTEAYAVYGSARRLDSYPTGGTPPGSEPELVREQLFGDAGVDLAIVIPQVRLTVDPELNAALCRAHNRWLAETWLERWDPGGRLYGTISVSLDDPHAAVREIREWADHPRFKQVLVGNYSERPLGFPQYEPVWAAAARHDLPVAMHNTAYGAGAVGATPVGRFQHWVDYHSVAFPITYAAHLVSWITGGVFDRHPGLRVVFVEGGYLWHRPVLARLARHWPAFRREAGAAARDPLDYVRGHVRFTSQPIEEQEDTPPDVARLMELAEAGRTLLYSSDYPHYDFDDPGRALPRGVGEDTRQRVMCGNARELYDLPRTRRAG